MRYIIYCDESSDKGRYYSNFYGGALLRANERELIEAALEKVKSDHKIKGEMKWTKITEYNEKAYIAFVDAIFELVESGFLKIRIMFTQNIHRVSDLSDYQIGNEFFMLYYQFVKHAFGLRYCNPHREPVAVSVFLDDVPNTREKFDSFAKYLSSLSTFPVFSSNRIVIPRDEITDVCSDDHVILQAVDVLLGAMQFRLNDLHKTKIEGRNRRGNRTRCKERVFKKISARIRGIRPGFNIGASTGQDGAESKWRDPYRHWRFVPAQSEPDLTRGKRWSGKA